MANRGVLVIYTGGTIGAVPTDPTDAQSPLAAASWDVLSADLPELDQLDFDIVARSTRRPIDSSNIVTDDWLEIAELIVSAYDDFEGFVVLHGTDTMAYSASALSFMLANLAKPVVFTGAQIPVVDRPESDGRSNLMAALAIANPDASEIACVPEVCIFSMTVCCAVIARRRSIRRGCSRSIRRISNRSVAVGNPPHRVP